MYRRGRTCRGENALRKALLADCVGKGGRQKLAKVGTGLQVRTWINYTETKSCHHVWLILPLWSTADTLIFKAGFIQSLKSLFFHKVSKINLLICHLLKVNINKHLKINQRTKYYTDKQTTGNMESTNIVKKWLHHLQFFQCPSFSSPECYLEHNFQNEPPPLAPESLFLPNFTWIAPPVHTLPHTQARSPIIKAEQTAFLHSLWSFFLLSDAVWNKGRWWSCPLRPCNGSYKCSGLNHSPLINESQGSLLLFFI